MSATFKIRSEMAGGAREAPGKVWFWELAAAVIDADRCVRCGVCVAACPSDSIGVGKSGLPELVRMCTGCSLCWDFCPRGGLRYEATWLADEGDVPSARVLEATDDSPDEQALPRRITGQDGGLPSEPGLGALSSSYTARTKRGLAGAQDGGVVTAILLAALESGEIDGALVARSDPDHPWKAVPFLARSAKELLECAGSLYSQTMALGALDLSRWGLEPDARIAVVGTPCEIQGLRALQSRTWPRGHSAVNAVVLSIALLCTKSFDYEGLMKVELGRHRAIAPEQVAKVDINHGKLLVWDLDGKLVVSEPIKEFHGVALKGCDECADFLGRGADISVGSVGSADGWSSVLVRTEIGAKAVAHAADSLDLLELEDPAALERLDAADRRTALRTLRRELDPLGPMFLDFDEHVAAYAGSDRGAVIDWR